MNERPQKRRGPIGWVAGMYRNDPIRVVFWAIALTIIAGLVAILP